MNNKSNYKFYVTKEFAVKLLEKNTNKLVSLSDQNTKKVIRVLPTKASYGYARKRSSIKGIPMVMGKKNSSVGQEFYLSAYKEMKIQGKEYKFLD